MNYHRICNQSNIMDLTSGAHAFTPWFQWGLSCSIFSFYVQCFVVRCFAFSSFFFLTDYDYSFGILKLFLNLLKNIFHFIIQILTYQICFVSNTSLNYTVLYNDSYINVFESFTFATLNCFLTIGERVFIFMFCIMMRTSYLLRKIYFVTMT